MPIDALTIAPVLLAVVLAVSAVGKLRAPHRSAEAFRDLKVPAPFDGRWAVTALPWGELAVALLLVVAGGWLGVAVSVAALLLFAAYLGLVVRALGFEEPVDCACFGEFAAGRISRRTVVRNAWLVALAVVAVALSLAAESVLSRLVAQPANMAWAGAAAAAALTTYLVAAGGRSDGAPSTDAGAPVEEGDYVRSLTPALPVTLGDGTETDLRRLSAQKAQLLLFVSEGCGPCVDVIAATTSWREQLPELDVRHVLALEPGTGTLTRTEEPLSIHDPSRRLPDSFGFRGTPTALLLGADGLLAGGPVTGGSAVPDFVAEILAELRGSSLELAQRPD